MLQPGAIQETRIKFGCKIPFATGGVGVFLSQKACGVQMVISRHGWATNCRLSWRSKASLCSGCRRHRSTQQISSKARQNINWTCIGRFLWRGSPDEFWRSTCLLCIMLPRLEKSLFLKKNCKKMTKAASHSGDRQLFMSQSHRLVHWTQVLVCCKMRLRSVTLCFELLVASSYFWFKSAIF